MIGQPFRSQCPHCGHEHDGITTSEGEELAPSTGDTTLCIRCGKWCVIDLSLEHKLRVPNIIEAAEIAHDPLCRGMYRAWKHVKGLH